MFLAGKIGISHFYRWWVLTLSAPNLEVLTTTSENDTDFIAGFVLLAFLSANLVDGWLPHPRTMEIAFIIER